MFSTGRKRGRVCLRLETGEFITDSAYLEDMGPGARFELDSVWYEVVRNVWWGVATP